MKCNNCGAENSGKFCEHCGSPVEQENASYSQAAEQAPFSSPAQKTKKPIFKQWWFYVIIVVVIIAIANGTKKNNNPDNNSTVNNTASTTVTVSSKASDTAKTGPYETTLKNGHFTAGIDFPAGTYNIEAIAGNGNVSSSNAFSGGLNTIMGVNPDEMYKKTFNNAKFPKGTVLSISNVTIKITSDKADIGLVIPRQNPLTETKEFSDGNYTAGTDFPAGLYDIIAVSGSGNVSSSNVFDGGINTIMGTKEDEMYQKEYKNIDFKKGVVLTVSGVKIKLVPSK